MFGKKPEGVEKKKKKSSGIPAVVWMFMGSLLTLMIGVFLYLWQPFKVANDSSQPLDGQPAGNHSPANANTTTRTPSGNKASNNEDYEFYDLLPEQDVTPIPDEVVTTERPTPKTNQRADVTLKLPTESFDNDRTYTPQDTYDGEVTTSNPHPDTKSGSNQTNSSAAHNTPDSQSDSSSDSSKPTQQTNAQDAVDPIEKIISQTGEKAKEAVSEHIKDSKDRTYILQINSYPSAEDADKRRAEVLLAGIDADVVKKTNNGETMYQVISESYDNKTAVFTAQQRLQSSGIDAFVVERKK